MPGATPVPIPNTAVKPRAANGSRTIGPARVGCSQVYGPGATKYAPGPSCFMAVKPPVVSHWYLVVGSNPLDLRTSNAGRARRPRRAVLTADSRGSARICLEVERVVPTRSGQVGRGIPDEPFPPRIPRIRICCEGFDRVGAAAPAAR
jgi:hypothetical protein